jgi:hypothetical protein
VILSKVNFDTEHKGFENFYKKTLAMCSVHLHTSVLQFCVQNTVCKKCKDREFVAAFQFSIYPSVVPEDACYLSGETCIIFLQMSLIIEIYIQSVV